jgi:hypothetical protein
MAWVASTLSRLGCAVFSLSAEQQQREHDLKKEELAIARITAETQAKQAAMMQKLFFEQMAWIYRCCSCFEWTVYTQLWLLQTLRTCNGTVARARW